MTGMKRKSEDIHASFAKNDLPQIPKRGGEAAVDVDVEGGKIMPNHDNRKEDDRGREHDSDETKKEQTIDGLFQRVTVVDGLGNAPNDFQAELLQLIYNNGGDITPSFIE